MKTIKSIPLKILLTISIAINLVLLSPHLVADNTKEASHKYQYILQNLIAYMNTYFVDPISEEKLLEGAVRGMMSASGDPYTRFLNHKEMQEFSSMEGGSKVGIGVELVIEAGDPVITAPMKGGPAEKAGVVSGDIITSIDGVATKNLDIQKMAGLISGPKGTGVLIGIKRSGFPDDLKFEIIRGEFQFNYVNTEWFDKEKIGYIQLTHFFGSQSGSIEEFENGIQAMLQKKARGVIIDLRDNTGGHLDMATVLAGMFLKKGSIIVKARGRYKPWDREVYSTEESAGKFTDIPLVVLVNAYSASASEIMAGALQDYQRARLIGEKTYGKASVQKIIRDLPNNSGAMITIQKYYTPKNRAIHQIGLKPDIVIHTPALNNDENFYYYKLNKEKFFEKFMKKYPVYSDSLQEIFKQQMHSRGWDFQKTSIVKILNSRYHNKSGVLDRDTDPQLRGAINALLSI